MTSSIRGPPVTLMRAHTTATDPSCTYHVPAAGGESVLLVEIAGIPIAKPLHSLWRQIDILLSSHYDSRWTGKIAR